MNIALAMFPKVHGVQTLDNWIFFFLITGLLRINQEMGRRGYTI